MSYVPIFSKFFDSPELSTDTKPHRLLKAFKHFSQKYHSGLPSLPELDWLVRNDDRKLITSTELNSIQAAYKGACVTAFGYWLGVGVTGLYFSRNLWQHWPTAPRVLLVAGSAFVPFYYFPIVRTDRGLLRELSTHDTWLGREIRDRTPPNFWAEEEQKEAKKKAKGKKVDFASEGYKPATKAADEIKAADALKDAAPAASLGDDHHGGHHH